MRSESQYARWGIPGWTLIIAIVLFAFLDTNSIIFNSITKLFIVNDNGESFWVIFFAAVMTVGAGIPIGYIIYQIYFYLRWSSPVSKNGFLPPAINGRMTEMEDSLRDIKKQKLGFNRPWRESIINETEDHRTFWYYINSLLHEAIAEIDKNDVHRKHLNYLKEAMHSLGASSVGFLLGYVIYLALKWQNGEINEFDLSIIIIFATTNFFFLFLGEQYRRKQKILKKHFLDTQAELFTYVLIFTFIILKLIASGGLIYYILGSLLVLLGFVWGWSANEDKNVVWSITSAITILSVISIRATGSAINLQNLNLTLFFQFLF